MSARISTTLLVPSSLKTFTSCNIKGTLTDQQLWKEGNRTAAAGRSESSSCLGLGCGSRGTSGGCVALGGTGQHWWWGLGLLPLPQCLPAPDKDEAALIGPHRQEQAGSRFFIRLCEESKCETEWREWALLQGTGVQEGRCGGHPLFSRRCSWRPPDAGGAAGRDPGDKMARGAPLSLGRRAGEVPRAAQHRQCSPFPTSPSRIPSTSEPNLPDPHIPDNKREKEQVRNLLPTSRITWMLSSWHCSAQTRHRHTCCGIMSPTNPQLDAGEELPASNAAFWPEKTNLTKTRRVIRDGKSYLSST